MFLVLPDLACTPTPAPKSSPALPTSISSPADTLTPGPRGSSQSPSPSVGRCDTYCPPRVTLLDTKGSPCLLQQDMVLLLTEPVAAQNEEVPACLGDCTRALLEVAPALHLLPSFCEPPDSLCLWELPMSPDLPQKVLQEIFQVKQKISDFMSWGQAESRSPLLRMGGPGPQYGHRLANRARLGSISSGDW